jgi:hypothetical protein
MARIQILELPEVYSGDVSETPFLLILDQVDDAEALQSSMQGAKELSGARGILAFTETVEIPANDASAFADPHATLGLHLGDEEFDARVRDIARSEISDHATQLSATLNGAQPEPVHVGTI